jgi:pimeloyl-ACP methyl ester carboxylesterase
MAQLRETVRFVRASDGQRLALCEVALTGDRGRPARARREGAAPCFLLVHGFAQNRLGFSLGGFPRALAERGARVFLGELRGHGESRVAAGKSWNLATHLDLDLPALLEGARCAGRAPAVHLIGHSMGGLLGCALLARPVPLASLTAIATPLLLGAGRPLVWLASALLGPFATIAPRGHRVPIDRFLAALSQPLARRDARGALRMLQRLTRLANPEAAEPEVLRAILASADAESPLVFEELARYAVLRRRRLAGVDLVAALHASKLPAAAVVGSDDIFAPRAAMAPFEAPGQAGPRLVIEIPGGAHVDAIAGRHAGDTVAKLWKFLFR